MLVDTVAAAGLAMEDQLFAAVNATDNSVVSYGAAGIFGLGFPTQRYGVIIPPALVLLLTLRFSFVESAYLSDTVRERMPKPCIRLLR